MSQQPLQFNQFLAGLGTQLNALAKFVENFAKGQTGSVSAPNANGDQKQNNKKAKKEKDPNAPKKPMSSYMIFNKARMSDIRSKNPSVLFSEIAKMVSEEWKNLSADKRKKYLKKEEEAKKQYILDLAEYNNQKQKHNLSNGAETAGKQAEKSGEVPKTKAEKKAEKIARKLQEKAKQAGEAEEASADSVEAKTPATKVAGNKNSTVKITAAPVAVVAPKQIKKKDPPTSSDSSSEEEIVKASLPSKKKQVAQPAKVKLVKDSDSSSDDSD